jgi:hypothetical protein
MVVVDFHVVLATDHSDFKTAWRWKLQTTQEGCLQLFENVASTIEATLLEGIVVLRSTTRHLESRREISRHISAQQS